MPPKKTDEKLMELLVEMEQWVTTNLDVLRSREGGCFKAKLHQLNGGEEKRLYKLMEYNKRRYEASPASAQQIAKLDRIVITTETEDRKHLARLKQSGK